MKKRILWVLLAIAANIALLPLALATPKDATAASSSGFFFHCCKETMAGDPYCCGYCCVFTFNCLGGGTCDEEF